MNWDPSSKPRRRSTPTQGLLSLLTCTALFLTLRGTGTAQETGPTTENPAQPEGGQQQAPTPSQNPAPFAIELSVHGTEKITAMIVWRIEKNNAETSNSAIVINRPFSLEWIHPPENATGFIVVPTALKELTPDIRWIPLNIARPEENIYVTFRRDHEGNMPMVDNNYKALDPDAPAPIRALIRKHTTGSKGWVYLGNWNPNTYSWSINYWVQEQDATDIARRRPVVAPPSALIDQVIVANFPVRFRTNSSTEHPEVSPGILVRPGTSVSVHQVRIHSGTTQDGVWAEVSIKN